MTPLSATNPDDSERGVQSEEQQTAPPIIDKSAEESEAEISIQTATVSEWIVPPEEKLTAPQKQLSAEDNQTEQGTKVSALWRVVAKNKRVNREWEALVSRFPENTRRCYEDLCNAPMLRKPGRVFPLKGKLYKGAWEYEVTKGDRVFYVPDEEKCKVVVYYAGAHIKPAPTPP